MQFVYSVQLGDHSNVLGEVTVDIPTPLLLHLLPLRSCDQLTVSNITVSDGIEIYQSNDIAKEDMFVYTQLNLQLDTLTIWYLLLKFLTGNWICCPELEDKIDVETLDNTQWLAELSNENTELNFVLQFTQDFIVKKIAKVIVPKQENVELDLFRLSDRLFQSFVINNSFINKLRNDTKRLQERNEKLLDERVQLDKLIVERDEKSKKIMVELLNSKKRKIIELENKLAAMSTSDGLLQNDSSLLNNNVAEPVSELNSPGKRRIKQKTPDKVTESIDLKSLEPVNLKIEDDSDFYIKKEEDEDEDFTPIDFMGINRKRKIHEDITNSEDNSTTRSANDSSSEQETDLESELDSRKY